MIAFYSTMQYQHVSNIPLLGVKMLQLQIDSSHSTLVIHGHPWLIKMRAQFGDGLKTRSRKMIHQYCPEFQPWTNSPWTACIP